MPARRVPEAWSGEGYLVSAQVTEYVLVAGLAPHVDSAAGALAAGGRLLPGQQQVQGGQVRQDSILADAGVLQPVRARRGGAGVTVATPVIT